MTKSLQISTKIHVFINHKKKSVKGNPLPTTVRDGITSVCTNLFLRGSTVSGVLVPEQLFSSSIFHKD